ncbi:MAG: hypothetical protein M1G31_14995 [Pseudanabaena sp. Salubria-1]|nr:hypothetical protein [Pseudanabaena sp. Salubria-1]
MRNQVWYVATLIGIMCLIRFGLSAIGYVDPHWLMQQLGAPLEANLQMPYIIRVWAIRDLDFRLKRRKERQEVNVTNCQKSNDQ